MLGPSATRVWRGPLDLSGISTAEENLELREIELWGRAQRRITTSRKKRDTGGSSAAGTSTPQPLSPSRRTVHDAVALRAVARVDLSRVRYWMVARATCIMDVYTNDDAVSTYLGSQLGIDAKGDATSRHGIVTKLVYRDDGRAKASDDDDEGVIIFASMISIASETDYIDDSDYRRRPEVIPHRLAIKAVTLQTVHRLASCMAPPARPTVPTFMQPSAEDVRELSIAQKRNRRLDNLLKRRRSASAGRVQPPVTSTATGAQTEESS
ncbi:uncharacterized protein V1518DRAFT_419403 [Limtongia smithiae]|uniref:uncharacterized protein n=1 Tax=Limtongia smithiae TaxID=1125753 RepID=UPI0034CE291C